jgi:hypothetical protein
MAKKKSSRRGRPKLEDGKAKSVLIQVRVTPEEAKQIEEQAAVERRPRSEWIRRRLTPDEPKKDDAPKPADPTAPKE